MVDRVPDKPLLTVIDNEVGTAGSDSRVNDQRVYSVHSPKYMRESGTPIVMLPDPDKALRLRSNDQRDLVTVRAGA